MKRSTCVYLIRDHRWLMLLRNRKEHDVNRGKWIGVGGKCEGEESFADCARREVKEETGLSLRTLDYRGIVDFHYDSLEPERIAVYTSQDFEGEVGECDEGTLAWIPEEEILNLELWEGDRVFLKKLLEKDSNQFYLVLVYDDAGTLISARERKGENEDE